MVTSHNGYFSGKLRLRGVAICFIMQASGAASFRAMHLGLCDVATAFGCQRGENGQGRLSIVQDGATGDALVL